jgi:hypothetical protein
MKANATTTGTLIRRAPRQLLELLIEPRNVAFDRSQRL